MNSKNKVLKFIEAKGKNKRINIYLLEDEEGSKAFAVHTKTLINFKTREILNSDTLYSVETFAALGDLFSYFLDDSEVKNKLILKQLDNITKFNAKTNLTKK